MKKKLMILILLILFLLGLFLFFYTNKNVCAKKDNKVCSLSVQNNIMNLKVAYSSQSQSRGLMFVEHLKENEGMIFVYDREHYMSFWMKNTLIPLSIAFVRYNGQIVDIYKMYPEPYASDSDLTRYSSSSACLYGIEMPINWFQNHNVKVGDYIKIPNALK